MLIWRPASSFFWSVPYRQRLSYHSCQRKIHPRAPFLLLPTICTLQPSWPEPLRRPGPNMTRRNLQISELYQTLTGTLLNDLPIVALRLLREGTDPALLREAVGRQLQLRREVRRDPKRQRAMRELLDLIDEEEQARPRVLRIARFASWVFACWAVCVLARFAGFPACALCILRVGPLAVCAFRDPAFAFWNLRVA